MTDRPIIFSAPMVRALIAGHKTQTRRIIKPAPEYGGPGKARDQQNWSDQDAWGWENHNTGGWDLLSEGYTGRARYATGDRLWVRESFTASDKHKFMVAYKADGECGAWAWDGDGKPVFIRHGEVIEAAPSGRGNFGFARYGGRWRSPIHMPRRFSRLTLTVTDVMAQRVQDISEADAFAEGAMRWGFDGPSGSAHYTVREDFARLWDSIHGPGAWARNDWVAAITFDVRKENIDNA